MMDMNNMSEEVILENINLYEKWFVNVNFGNGIMVRSTVWPDEPLNSRQAGIGKFDFIVRRNLPDLQGKRILDIGCNVGIIAIQMARLGPLL